MTQAHSGLGEPAAMTIDELLAKAEDLRQLIDSLRDELDDVEAELDRREAAVATETDAFRGGSSFESTPIVWQGRVYVGCRDGYFYCLGER